MTSQIPSLAELGWKPFFSSQTTLDDLSVLLRVRVTAVHRDRIAVIGDGFGGLVSSRIEGASSEEDHPAVGDWVLLDRRTLRPARLLDRSSLFKRRTPGTGLGIQLVAANVDTLFVVSSCNPDFNLARLERYLVLAREAEVTPVVVLTKTDLAPDPESYARQARALRPGLLVETVDARDPRSVACLATWCAKGQTVALLGSSGVGKSTLVNTLTGAGSIATGAIREDDAKGRHTTTARSMHRLGAGGWLLDTPGMRELQLADSAAAIEDVFGDISALARHCRFADCTHETEPGCAVLAAVAAQTLDPARLGRWRKLVAEDAHNTRSLAERRARDRAFGKMVRDVVKEKGKEKDR